MDLDYIDLLDKNGSLLSLFIFVYCYIIDELKENNIDVKTFLYGKSQPMPRNINRRYVQDMSQHGELKGAQWFLTNQKILRICAHYLKTDSFRFEKPNTQPKKVLN